MKLVFGIGNPLIEYKYTYHNLGLLFADYIILNLPCLSFEDEKKFTLYKFETFYLIKSKVYMNCSFSALKDTYNFYKFKLSDLIVLYDDLNMRKYKLKFKSTEGLGGHNGLRDIAKNIGPLFGKFGFGIDHPKNFNPNLEVSDYVLSKLNIKDWEVCFAEALKILRTLL